MKRGDPGLDPEWRDFLKLRKVQRRVPANVRARVLARTDQTGTLGGFLGPPATTPLGKAQLRLREVFLAGRPARQAPRGQNDLSGPPPGARAAGQPWGRVGLIVSVAVASGAVGAVVALRHLTPRPPPAVTEPTSDVTGPPAEAPPPALEAARPAVAEPPAPRPSRAHRSPPAADLLPAELALLQRARDAYVGHRFSDALGLLAEHARRFPRGRLAEEREALRVRALRASGRTEEARRAAAAFAARFPRSILLRRAHDAEDAPE